MPPETRKPHQHGTSTSHHLPGHLGQPQGYYSPESLPSSLHFDSSLGFANPFPGVASGENYSGTLSSDVYRIKTLEPLNPPFQFDQPRGYSLPDSASSYLPFAASLVSTIPWSTGDNNSGIRSDPAYGRNLLQLVSSPCQFRRNSLCPIQDLVLGPLRDTNDSLSPSQEGRLEVLQERRGYPSEIQESICDSNASKVLPESYDDGLWTTPISQRYTTDDQRSTHSSGTRKSPLESYDDGLWANPK